MTTWRPPEGEGVAPPDVARTLLETALAADPGNPRLHAQLAALALDRFDFAAAEAGLARALALDPAMPHLRSALAHCRNLRDRPREALDALAACQEPQYERAVALKRLGRDAEAEAELRALLEADPQHRHACRQLCKWLRKSRRGPETLAICETLHAHGAAHAQLFHDWGFALALAGDEVRARALLFDAAKLAEIRLPAPAGFADTGTFNAALAEEILSSPHVLSNFAQGEEANRGSRRLHALFAGRRPELFRALLDRLQAVVDDWQPPHGVGFDPWHDARPRTARVRAWALIQQGRAYEEWHIHRGGWASGVYYVRIPEEVARAEDGRGAIEYGPPPRLEDAMPGLVTPARRRPREGFLLLAPSHYPHRTIPPQTSSERISFAFDVVPCA
jgi:tetratricopeptide (TPR) repeat protein